MLTTSIPPLDYSELLMSDLPEPATLSRVLRVGLLSDAATQQFVPVLNTLFARAGIMAQIFEGAFDAIEIEAYNPESGLYRFHPEIIVILNSVQALRSRFGRRTGSHEDFIAETDAGIQAVWNQIQANSRATILQSTFALPGERVFGNLDLKVPQSFYSVVSTLNARIAAAARGRSGILMNDVEYIASLVGRRTFFDDRYWDMWKSFCALEALPRVAQNIVDIAVGLTGRAIKCVICDLDNTLWGGVVGDDGVSGIKLNAHGDGEAYYRLQLFLKELQRRGILLAVCSKNEESNAKAPFVEHPDSALKLNDFAAFIANWDDKAHNIRHIQKHLNIGFDSMVFLDDNPFERTLVRELIPEVLVPELPEDPSEYVRYLSELNLFEVASFSVEDLQRSEMYAREAERTQEAAGFASVEDFMRSLNMVLELARFDDFHLPRLAQLFQRSNQFNLTTRRHSEAALSAMMKSPDLIPLYAKLSDRLGDHGLIGIVVLEKSADELVILDWLMSCRVLARGVEQQMMNQVFALAKALNLTYVSGRYIPTAKNSMVRDVFARFGFRQLAGEPADGMTAWQLEADQYVEKPTFISLDMKIEELQCRSTTMKLHSA